jgi:EmrB/QacA subfamily drug resistance transporter
MKRTERQNVNQPDSPSFWPLIAALVFGSFLSTLSTTSLNVAIPELMHAFGAPLGDVQWTLTITLLAVGTISPVTGFLGERMGHRRLYLMALALFTLASALCAAAWSLPALILFRALQGIACGLIVPSTMTMIYQTLPRAEQAMGIALWSTASMLAPAIGPTLSGWLLGHAGWPAIFLFNLPIGLLAIAVAARFIPTGSVGEPGRFDLLGFLAAGVTGLALLVAFTQGGTWGWGSGRTLGLIAVGLAALALFIRHELQTSQPMLDLRVFAYPVYTRSVIINAIVTAGLYAGVLLTPLYLERVKGLSALDTGLLLLPASLCMVIFMPVAGRLYHRFQPRGLIGFGILMLTLGTVPLGRLTPASGRGFILTWMAIRYIGVAFVTMPVTNTGMGAVPRALSGHASALNNWIRQGAASLAIGVYATLLTSRTAAHLAALGGGGNATPRAVQALTMGINDLYLLSALLTLLALPLALWLRRTMPEPLPAL